MIVNKACRYRLYPTTEQKMMFAKTFGCVRFIYNKMLSDRLDYYKETGKKLHNTPAQYKEEFPWLKEVDSLALANAQMNLNKAYNNFWNDSKHFGKPRFKSKKNRRASYSTNNQKGSVRIEGQGETAESRLGEIMPTSSLAGEQYHKDRDHQQDAIRKVLYQYAGGV